MSGDRNRSGCVAYVKGFLFSWFPPPPAHCGKSIAWKEHEQNERMAWEMRFQWLNLKHEKHEARQLEMQRSCEGACSACFSEWSCHICIRVCVDMCVQCIVCVVCMLISPEDDGASSAHI